MLKKGPLSNAEGRRGLGPSKRLLLDHRTAAIKKRSSWKKTLIVGNQDFSTGLNKKAERSEFVP